MSDDLKARLAIPCFENGLDEGWIDAERLEALARIEALERERDAAQKHAREKVCDFCWNAAIEAAAGTGLSPKQQTTIRTLKR